MLNVHQKIIMLNYVWQQGTNENNSAQMMKSTVSGLSCNSSADSTPRYTSQLSKQLC